MKLFEILDGIECHYDDDLKDKEVKDIKIDSRLVKEGDIFVALKGEKFDGNKYISQALANGAVAVISDENVGDKIVCVPSARKAYALACKNYFGRACDKLKIVGVTGTNGKTTTTFITKEVLLSSGLKAGVICTLGADVGGEKVDTGFTTPDPYILHKIFKEMLDEGTQYVVMEASAHALYLDKLEGIKFEIGVLTNITEDHLDYFKNMNRYSKAKFKLFEEGRVKLGIVCGDDIMCRKLLKNPQVPLISYGLSNGNDITATDIVQDSSGVKFKFEGLGKEFNVKCPLVGEYNIQNILASSGICLAFGVPIELVRLGLSKVNPVEGRFNVIKMGGVTIVIDFAHTPDGLEKVLTTARKITDGRLTVVFGCGGNRDKMKRPIMGKVAQDFADNVILTSDNPRFEEPEQIISEIADGMELNSTKMPNRKDAIRYALSNAKDGETIVIAGKGGEKYQEIKGEKIPYNDFDEVYSFYRNKIKEVENE